MSDIGKTLGFQKRPEGDERITKCDDFVSVSVHGRVAAQLVSLEE